MRSLGREGDCWRTLGFSWGEVQGLTAACMANVCTVAAKRSMAVFAMFHAGRLGSLPRQEAGGSNQGRSAGKSQGSGACSFGTARTGGCRI